MTKSNTHFFDGSPPLPVFVPNVQFIELFFFQRVFTRLWQVDEARRAAAVHGPENVNFAELSQLQAPDDQEVLVCEFERVMVRFLRLVNDDSVFDINAYDGNCNGMVGWYEFCAIWKDRHTFVNLSCAERIFLTFEDPDRSIMGKVFSFILFSTICTTTASFVISTIPGALFQIACPLVHEDDFDENCRPTPRDYLWWVDYVCVMILTFEYSIRVVTSFFARVELLEREKHKLLSILTCEENVVMPSGAWRVFEFIFSPPNIIDALAIMPWYIEHLSGAPNGFISVMRLTRVIRAFRLGRRFEAVVIIIRTLSRSLRALYVLILNLLMGMVVFGSLMYMAEQGTWDSARKEYVREIGLVWNSKDYKWESVTEKSPFESIPACFWWAIVTATTVGYGDVFTPRTLPGKLVAGFAMVWSLCVLALPIGVIGGHFENVWQEYDDEKRAAIMNIKREEISLRKSMAFCDPLFWGKRVSLTIWHNSGISTNGYTQSEFLGEAELPLKIDNSEEVPLSKVRLQLKPNFAQARRQVRGSLTIEYSWEPDEPRCDVLLAGVLQVTVIKAEQLYNIDWSGNSSDAYCEVRTYPRPPNQGGKFDFDQRFTHTVRSDNTTDPVWNKSFTFNVCWNRAGSDRGVRLSMQASRILDDFDVAPAMPKLLSAPTVEPPPLAEPPPMPKEPPKLDSDNEPPCDTDNELTNKLKQELPALKEEVLCMRQDMHRILLALQTMQPQILNSRKDDCLKRWQRD